MTGVVCPSVFEFRMLDRAAIRKRGAVLVQSGMGKLRALTACAALHRRHPELKNLLLVGFAGALAGDLGIGDVIEPRLFIEHDYCAEPFEKFPNRIRTPYPRLVRASAGATMLTQDRFLTQSPDVSAFLGPRRRQLACDMESYAVAHYGRETGLRYFVVKLISDRADETADHDFLKACRRLKPKLNRTVLEALGRLS